MSITICTIGQMILPTRFKKKVLTLTSKNKNKINHKRKLITKNGCNKTFGNTMTDYPSISLTCFKLSLSLKYF